MFCNYQYFELVQRLRRRRRGCPFYGAGYPEVSHDINHDKYYRWITALRLEYINNTDYGDVAQDDNMVCQPFFEETEKTIKVKAENVLEAFTEEMELHEVSHGPCRSWCK